MTGFQWQDSSLRNVGRIASSALKRNSHRSSHIIINRKRKSRRSSPDPVLCFLLSASSQLTARSCPDVPFHSQHLFLQVGDDFRVECMALVRRRDVRICGFSVEFRCIAYQFRWWALRVWIAQPGSNRISEEVCPVGGNEIKERSVVMLVKGMAKTKKGR